MQEKKQRSTGQGFTKSVRLLKQAEFDRVHQGQWYAADATLVIKAQTNELSRSRLGLSISKKVGNAVVRNRWKRLIRESFRIQRQELPQGLDIVVRPRKGAECDFNSIFESIKLLMLKVERRIKKSHSKSGTH